MGDRTRAWDEEGQKEEKAICDEYIDLFEKSQQLFSGLRDLPQFGNQWQPYFQKAFEVYTKLWAFQQTYRTVLESKESYGLKRWEIGEIASKIGQLYYHFYLRTSETVYLRESFVFYEAIKTRNYFKDVLDTKSAALVVKKLRYYARFIVVSLLLNRRNLIKDLVEDLAKLIEEYYDAFKPSDIQEWHFVLQEINLFLQADSPLKISDEKPDSKALQFPSSSSRVPRGNNPSDAKTRLQEAILVGNLSHQVKFSELTLDMFRVIEALEYELSPDDELNVKDSVESDKQKKSKNPRKYLLYRPSVSQLLLFVAAAFKDLQEKNVLLIYIAADGIKSAKPESPGGLIMSSKKTEVSEQQTQLATSFYGEDLLPFTRKPLMLIIDSDNAVAFKHLTSPFGAPLLCLLSPQLSLVERKASRGSEFTYFLNSPVSAFCQALGLTKVSNDQFTKANEALNAYFASIRKVFAAHSQSLEPVYMQFIEDEILLHFISKYLLCFAFFHLLKTTHNKRDYYPSAVPAVPDSVVLHDEVSSCVFSWANIFRVADSFIDKSGI